MKTLKVVIAGSRTINNYAQLVSFIAEVMPNYPEYQRLLIMTGGARGVDLMGKRYAKENRCLYKEFRPQMLHALDYDAFLRRNKQMARQGDILICLWNNTSTGTRHMINSMKGQGKPVHVFNTLTNEATHDLHPPLHVKK